MVVFIKRGDAPLTARQAINRGLQKYDAELALYKREAGLLTGDQSYVEWANQWLNDNVVNTANNAFNWQLAEYRKATARLAQYRLADGSPEQSFEELTGEYDADGNEIMHTWTIAAIQPLPAEVEQTSYDDFGNATVVMVPNPAIVQDDAEREAAQAVVDVTPLDVVSFS